MILPPSVFTFERSRVACRWEAVRTAGLGGGMPSLTTPCLHGRVWSTPLTRRSSPGLTLSHSHCNHTRMTFPHAHMLMRAHLLVLLDGGLVHHSAGAHGNVVVLGEHPAWKGRKVGQVMLESGREEVTSQGHIYCACMCARTHTHTQHTHTHRHAKTRAHTHIHAHTHT